MPFKEELNDIYQEVIKDVALESNFTSSRADEIYSNSTIMADVLKGIEEAEVIIADLTNKNPNVLYELGLAHCRKVSEKVIILSQNINDVPFDIKHYRVIIYKNSISGAKKLKRDLIDALNAIRIKKLEWASSIWQPRTPNWHLKNPEMLMSMHQNEHELAMIFCNNLFCTSHFRIAFNVSTEAPEVNVMLFADGENRMSGYHLWFWHGGVKIAKQKDEKVLNTEIPLRKNYPENIIIEYKNGKAIAKLNENIVLTYDDAQPLHGILGFDKFGINTWSQQNTNGKVTFSNFSFEEL